MIRLIALALLGTLLLSGSASAAYTGPEIFDTGACLTGGPVPPNPVTIAGDFQVNVQSGTSYAIVAGDKCKFVKLTNAAAVAVTLPGTVLPAGWMTFLEDRGAGGAMITPGAGQIEGASGYAIVQDSPVAIFSDGSNYHVWGFTAGGSGTCSNVGDFACLNLDEVWAARQQVPCTVLTDASTISITASAKNAFCVTITGNTHKLGNPTGLQAATYIFVINQNGHTGFSTDTQYKYPGGVTPTWSTGIDLLVCYADTTSRLLCTAGPGMN